MSRWDRTGGVVRTDRRPAFVATTGGHLVQLMHLAPLIEPERHRDGLWITHRTPQSESMLEDRNRVFMPPIHARQWGQALGAMPSLLCLLRRSNIDVIYSTGAAISVAALPAAPLAGARPVFIESLARVSQPSLAGRVHQWLPWVERFTQYPQNADRRWKHRFSLLEAFRGVDADPVTPRRVLVTLGTARPWGFRSLLERLVTILPPDIDVVWQTGVTDVSDLPIDAVPFLSDDGLQAEIHAADVVVAHAGVGTMLRCLEAGRVPVLVPRRVHRGEHVDDHQVQIAEVAASRGLAVVADAEDLEMAHLITAGRRQVVHGVPV